MITKLRHWRLLIPILQGHCGCWVLILVNSIFDVLSRMRITTFYQPHLVMVRRDAGVHCQVRGTLISIRRRWQTPALQLPVCLAISDFLQSS